MGAKFICSASLYATREFVGLVRVLNLLVVVAMITTRTNFAWGTQYLLCETIFARPFCGNQFIACTQIQAGFFAKTASAVLAENGKSEMEKVK